MREYCIAIIYHDNIFSGRLLEIQEEKLQLKRKLLSLEQKKVSLLDDILKEIKNNHAFVQSRVNPQCLKCLPVIHGLTFKEI